MKTDELVPFENPKVRLDGKEFMVKIAFQFSDWIDPFTAKNRIEKFIAENGIPQQCISNVTPYDEYK